MTLPQTVVSLVAREVVFPDRRSKRLLNALVTSFTLNSQIAVLSNTMATLLLPVLTSYELRGQQKRYGLRSLMKPVRFQTLLISHLCCVLSHSLYPQTLYFIPQYSQISRPYSKPS